MNPWSGISFVLIILAGLMTVLRWYQHRYTPHPELVRKLLHICMGLTMLTFPWLFSQLWPVMLLVAITVPGLLFLRRSQRLKKQFGGVICGVNRSESWGEIYFPLGVAALFILSGGDTLRYTIPILLLTLADAGAALIGTRYGRIKYTTLEGHKSVEGSLGFLSIAFCSVLIPLFLFSKVDLTTALLIALILGLLMVIIEAIAWHGLDNLFIPIFGFLLLDTFLKMTPFELTTQVALTMTLTIFALQWRTWANLHDNALLGAALMGYSIWSLADWRWFVAPLTVFVAHIVLASGTIPRPTNNTPPAPQPYNIYAIISVVSGGLLWLFLYRLFNRPDFLYPFTLSFAIQLTLLIIVTHKHNGRPTSNRLILESVVIGWLALGPLYFM